MRGCKNGRQRAGGVCENGDKPKQSCCHAKRRATVDRRCRSKYLVKHLYLPVHPPNCSASNECFRKPIINLTLLAWSLSGLPQGRMAARVDRLPDWLKRKERRAKSSERRAINLTIAESGSMSEPDWGGGGRGKERANSPDLIRSERSITSISSTMVSS